MNTGFKNVIPVLDNKEELQQYKKSVKVPFKLGIRIAAEEEPTFPFYTSRLGFRARDVLEFYVDKIEGNEDRFQLKMLHIFLNKGIKDDIYYWSELNKVINLYCQLKKICPELDSINIGGGFPIKHSLGFDYDYQFMINEIVRNIKSVCKKNKVPMPNIFTEFGSYTVGESMAHIYSVIGQKVQNDREIWYMIDSGGMDAANILKPALARGDLQCIGATTLDEYRKHIERDAALERRFQPILVGEPSVEETIEILYGLRSAYEQHHRVQISDEAVVAAAKLSDRYISDRFLPDKAIDLIDEAGSRVRLRYSTNTANRELKKELAQVIKSKNEAVRLQDFDRAGQLRDRELELEAQLNELSQNDKAVNSPIVDEEDIAQIVASWTGVPVNKLTESESELLLHLEDTLHRLYEYLPAQEKATVTHFEEVTGKGVFATVEGHAVKLGSSQFLQHLSENTHKKTKVHVEIDGVYKGSYVFNNQYREGLEALFERLSASYHLVVLSGDNDGERKILEKMLPAGTSLVFNQKPEAKLAYIEALQQEGKNVMMVGDGLNDAGALAQSNVGLSISENVNVFSPACDGILDASQFSKIGYFLQYARNAMKIIYMSFAISLLYNVVGLTNPTPAAATPALSGTGWMAPCMAFGAIIPRQKVFSTSNGISVATCAALLTDTTTSATDVTTATAKLTLSNREGRTPCILQRPFRNEPTIIPKAVDANSQP
ncbi:hypothetical protein NUACC21_00220 [Scytonema sp. NUACC21]